MTSAPRTPFAPWDRRELPGSFTVEETARRVGHYKWFEMRIFELMAGWIATVPELDVKLKLGAHSYHHAFHSELWHKRLPELREMNPERKTMPPNAELEAFVEALGAPEGDDKTLEKLVGMYRVALPVVIGTYTYHRNNTSQITDAPTIRSLNFCLNDDMEEWVEAEMTIQSLITNGNQARRAADHQAELTTLLLSAGGIAGPGSVGSFDLESNGSE